MKIRLVQYRDIIDCMRFDGSYHNADVNVYDSAVSYTHLTLPTKA